MVAVIFGVLSDFEFANGFQPTVFHVTLASNLPSLKKGPTKLCVPPKLLLLLLFKARDFSLSLEVLLLMVFLEGLELGL